MTVKKALKLAAKLEKAREIIAKIKDELEAVSETDD